VLRPQTLVVLAVILPLLVWGGGQFVADPRHAGDTSVSAGTIPAADIAVGSPTPADDAAVPLPTPRPPTLAATLPPTPTPAPSVALTPTPAPVPTQRPVAPPTGDEGAAIVISQPQTGRQEVALTFDAGEGVGHTQEILDILDQHGVVATFGVTGEWALANPTLMQEIVTRGHQVMNHSYSHGSFTGASTGTEAMTPEQMRQEVLDTDQAIRETTNDYDDRGFFRFPYGDYNDESLRVLKETGYDYSVWWGCDSLAWNGNTADQIVQLCGQDKLAPGLIVLLHVTQDADLGALPGLIERYRASGYAMVTIEQLIQP
jgi:peptidoglycan-N-acetylglucosamine deacetylase